VAAENCILGSFRNSIYYRIFLDQLQDAESDGSCSVWQRWELLIKFESESPK
jgi:hypothetical protein